MKPELKWASMIFRAAAGVFGVLLLAGIVNGQTRAPVTTAPHRVGPGDVPRHAPAATTPQRVGPGDVPKRAPAATTSYRVGPGDVLKIVVWREPDISGEHQVSAAGTIHHFLLGDIRVGGRTCEEIEKEIRRRLGADYMKNPKVGVRVKEFHSQQIYILGQVGRPGDYLLEGRTTILQMLLRAGGPMADAEDRISVLRLAKAENPSRGRPKSDGRGNGSLARRIEIDLNALLREGDLRQNIEVQAGDIIYVPRRKGSGMTGATAMAGVGDMGHFYILGEVARPGMYPIEEGTSALNAILAAGGFTEYASANKSKLIRRQDTKEKVTQIRLGDLFKKGRTQFDVKLQAGDVLVIPKSLF